jgi:hypothetical protein
VIRTKVSSAFFIYAGQKQGISRKAAKLAKNNKTNHKAIQSFLCVFAALRENSIFFRSFKS